MEHNATRVASLKKKVHCIFLHLFFFKSPANSTPISLWPKQHLTFSTIYPIWRSPKPMLSRTGRGSYDKIQKMNIKWKFRPSWHSIFPLIDMICKHRFCTMFHVRPCTTYGCASQVWVTITDIFFDMMMPTANAEDRTEQTIDRCPKINLQNADQHMSWVMIHKYHHTSKIRI